jgi:hypothetical protein
MAKTTAKKGGKKNTAKAKLTPREEVITLVIPKPSRRECGDFAIKVTRS